LAKIIGFKINWKKGVKAMVQNHALRGKFVFIMGGGKFGTEAVKYMKNNNAKVLVVDINPHCIAKSEVTIEANELQTSCNLVDGQAAFLLGDAINILLSVLETKMPDLIVTAIPGNVVAKVVEKWLEKKHITLKPNRNIVPKVLENIPKSLLSFVDEDCAVIIVSYMPPNMSCRKNCLPPKGMCASTGRLKLATMDRLLEFSVQNLTNLAGIFVSRQLTGGLGAIEGKELHSFLRKVEKINKQYTLAIGTACDCHGIVSFVKLTKK
jgi:hypothetical protein